MEPRADSSMECCPVAENGALRSPLLPLTRGPHRNVVLFRSARFTRWARRGIWEKNLFQQFAGNGGSADAQMIDSTHVKAHRSASGGKGGTETGRWPLARRTQREDTRTRRC